MCWLGFLAYFRFFLFLFLHLLVSSDMITVIAVVCAFGLGLAAASAIYMLSVGVTTVVSAVSSDQAELHQNSSTSQYS